MHRSHTPRRSINHSAASAHPEPSLLLRIPEAARLLGLGRTKVYDLINRGELPVVDIDGARRIDRADVEAFITHRKRQNA